MNTIRELDSVFIPKDSAERAFSKCSAKHAHISQALIEWFADRTFFLENTEESLKTLSFLHVNLALICTNVEKSPNLKKETIRKCAEAAYALILDVSNQLHPEKES